MSKYTFKIEADGVDISNAVLAGFSITNGRSRLTQGFVQWSANLSAYKKEIESILNTAGKNSDYITPGTEILISVKTGTTTWLSMFKGVINGVRSTAYEYQFDCIDEVYFGLSKGLPKDNNWNTDLDGVVQSVSVRAETPFYFDSFISVNNMFPVYDTDWGIRSDYAAMINEAALLARYTFLEIFLPDDRILPFGGKIKVGQLLDTDVSTTDFSITDQSIDLDYSLERSASELFNTITVDFKTGSVTVVDKTSVNKIGTKLLTVESNFRDVTPAMPGTPQPQNPPAAVAARQLAEALLQQYSLYNFAVINFKTSADRLGLTVENTVKKVFPRKIVDSSAMTPPEFQEKMVVQQVKHRCSPDYWEINVLAANYRFVSASQPWNEVTSNLKWSDVPSYLTWDMIRTKDL
jgi:hypothetical protein